VKFC